MFKGTSPTASNAGPSKYTELLAVIEELGKDIRPTYAGSKNASERLKKGLKRIILFLILIQIDGFEHFLSENSLVQFLIYW